MNIILSGGWGYGNLGDEAILRCTLYELKNRFPDYKIIVTSYNPHNTKKLHGLISEISLHGLIRDYNNKKQLKKYINNENYFPISKELTHYIELFDEKSIFIMGGGGYFNEVWKESYDARIMELEIAKKRKCKIFLMGQTIGPINNKSNINILKNSLNGVDKIYPRDKQSYSNLKNIVPNEKLQLTSDVVNEVNLIYQFKKKQVNGLHSISIMFCSNREYLGARYVYKGRIISKLKKVFNHYSGKDKLYDKKVKSIINKILNSNENVNINYVVSTNWDRKFIEKLICDIDKKRINIMENLSVEEYIKVLAESDYVISTNMHPLIIANAYNVPITGISYTYKTDDFMKSINRGKHVFNINKFSDEDIIRDYKEQQLYRESKDDKENYILIKNAFDDMEKRIRRNE